MKKIHNKPVLLVLLLAWYALAAPLFLWGNGMELLPLWLRVILLAIHPVILAAFFIFVAYLHHRMRESRDSYYK